MVNFEWLEPWIGEDDNDVDDEVSGFNEITTAAPLMGGSKFLKKKGGVESELEN